jgi:molecular chaperone GrpE
MVPRRTRASDQGSPPPLPPEGERSSETPESSPASFSAESASAESERYEPAAQQEEEVERDLSELLRDVARERDEYLELARRTKADFENYRKRVAGEAREGEKRGRAALARNVLPVLDNLDRALAAEKSADRPRADDRVSVGSSPLAEGVRLVREELAGVLKRSGVESYEPAGEPFDPHEHEAMMTRPAPDGDDGKVLEVLEKGYRLDGEIIRPARVVVGEKNENRPAGGEPPAGFQAG